MEKNAILEVIFGNIFTKPYCNNPFPFLTENYHDLSPDDRQLVRGKYNALYQQYDAVRKKYGERIKP